MYQYYLFYKPFQVLCQFSPEADKKTLADYLIDIPKDVYPVGRLDSDSEGLLVLTNDKTLTHQLLTPSFSHHRTYYAQVEGELTIAALQSLEKGVAINIDGKQHITRKAKAEVLLSEPDLPHRDPPIRFRKDKPTSWLSLTITEGKNRQVRRMTAAVGFPTLRLVRYAIGAVNINGLMPGSYISVGTEIKKQLFKS